MPGHIDTPTKHGRNAGGKGIKWFGILYDEYTPAVEGQLLRDCLILINVAQHKFRDLIIVCDDPRPDRLLNALGLSREADTSRAKDWISYRTAQEWPDEPEGARNIIQRDLYVPEKEGNMTVLNEKQNNGYYLPPQGRLSPDTISLLRPSPNGYAYMPVEPAFLMMWT
jgi:hypothetical protein